jgi:hypothetical protein
MRLALIPFLQTVSATAALASGLFFLRFWRDSRDRLFAFFGVGFCALALQWALLALINPSDETRPYVYAIRLVAFLLMIIGMVDKNRSSRV